MTYDEITIRFKQILNKSFLPKRLKLKRVKHLAFLAKLTPFIEDLAVSIAITPIFISILYVVTYITSA